MQHEFNFQKKSPGHEDIKRLKDHEEKVLAKQRAFAEVFKGKLGQEVLDYLDTYSKFNFPNYENVNATYAKAGQQQMVDHIRMMIHKAKKKGGK